VRFEHEAGVSSKLTSDKLGFLIWNLNEIQFSSDIFFFSNYTHNYL